jgi:hypothetical protein
MQKSAACQNAAGKHMVVASDHPPGPSRAASTTSSPADNARYSFDAKNRSVSGTKTARSGAGAVSRGPDMPVIHDERCTARWVRDRGSGPRNIARQGPSASVIASKRDRSASVESSGASARRSAKKMRGRSRLRTPAVGSYPYPPQWCFYSISTRAAKGALRRRWAELRKTGPRRPRVDGASRRDHLFDRRSRFCR